MGDYDFKYSFSKIQLMARRNAIRATVPMTIALSGFLLASTNNHVRALCFVLSYRSLRGRKIPSLGDGQPLHLNINL